MLLLLAVVSCGGHRSCSVGKMSNVKKEMTLEGEQDLLGLLAQPGIFEWVERVSLWKEEWKKRERISLELEGWDANP